MVDDAFAHHVWASIRLLDACAGLTPEQLETSVPGTYGSILETARHLVGSDAFYLFRITGDESYVIDEDHMNVPELRDAIAGHATVWPKLLREHADPDAILVVRFDDGSETHVATGVRIAQVLHHGTDHRSQIATALTTLGIDPPGIDVWAYAEETDRMVDVPPSSWPDGPNP